MEGTVASDGVAQIRDGIKSVATTGFCRKPTGPITLKSFGHQAVSKGLHRRLQKTFRVLPARPQIANQMKGCLASGYPFVFGFSVYESFESPHKNRPCSHARPHGKTNGSWVMLATTTQSSEFSSGIPGVPAGE